MSLAVCVHRVESVEQVWQGESTYCDSLSKPADINSCNVPCPWTVCTHRVESVEQVWQGESTYCDSLSKPADINYCNVPCPGQCLLTEWSQWSKCDRVSLPTVILYLNLLTSTTVMYHVPGSVCLQSGVSGASVTGWVYLLWFSI